MEPNSSWSDLETIKISIDTVFKKVLNCNKHYKNMTLNVLLRFFDSRYKFSLSGIQTRDSQSYWATNWASKILKSPTKLCDRATTNKQIKFEKITFRI